MPLGNANGAVIRFPYACAMLSRCRFFVSLLGIAALNAQLFPLHVVRVEGTNRFPNEAIVEASGVAAGSQVQPSDFEVASNRIQETGFFQTVRYQYAPATINGKAGYTLILQVQEIKSLFPVRIDIPGFDEEEVWVLLSEQAPFARKQVPSNPEAERYYTSAIEKIVEERKGAHEEITIRIEGDLATGQASIVILPAVLPKLAEIRIEGNSAVSSQAIQEALGRVAIGEDYTNYMFRQYLDLNVKPL